MSILIISKVVVPGSLQLKILTMIWPNKEVSVAKALLLMHQKCTL